MGGAAEAVGFSGDNERGGVFAVDVLRARASIFRPLDLLKTIYATVVPRRNKPTSHWKFHIGKAIVEGLKPTAVGGKSLRRQC